MWRDKLKQLVPSSRPRWAWMPRYVASNFVDLLFLLLAVLERHDIPYVAHWGTLLGAERLGGVLPWDDDHDIYVLDETTASVRAKIEADLKRVGIEMVYEPRDFFWVRQRGWLAASGHIGFSILPPCGTPDDHALTESELFPLRRYPFYGSHIWGPAQCESVFERLYGELGTPATMARFERAPISRGCHDFWARRPDWEAIVARFGRRHPLSPLLHAPWWWLNGAYLLAVPRLRGWARRYL